MARIVKIYPTKLLLTINPNKEYDEKGTWAFAQEVYMRLVLGDSLLYIWEMKYSPKDKTFFNPTDKEIRGISDEFVARGSAEIGSILERFHLHVIVEYWHEGHVKISLDKLNNKLKEIAATLNKEKAKKNPDWKEIKLTWARNYSAGWESGEEGEGVPPDKHQYLTKDKPASKQIDIDCVYILPRGEKLKKSGLINKGNGAWE